MQLTQYSPVYFNFLSRWITNPDLLFQFAGTEFSYPITENQIINYQQENPGRSFYSGLDDDNKPIAFGEIIPQKNHIPRIGRLLIGNPDERGKGYGTSFIYLLLEECKQIFQTKTVELFVLEDNISVIKCYQKIGFQFLPGQTWRLNHQQQNFVLHKMAYNC